LEEHFDKSGRYYHEIVRGVHQSEVKPYRARKSLAAERTFTENISSEVFMLERLEEIAAEVARRLEKNGLAGKTITLKIKYSDFQLQTRSRTLADYIATPEVIMENVKDLLYQQRMKESVRLLGISLSNLNNDKSRETVENKEGEIVDVQLKFDF
jgi:DNA polymerase-4